MEYSTENNKIAKLTCLFFIFFNMLKNKLNPRILKFQLLKYAIYGSENIKNRSNSIFNLI